MIWDDRSVRGMAVVLAMAVWICAFAVLSELDKATSLAERAYARAEQAGERAEDQRDRRRSWWPFD